MNVTRRRTIADYLPNGAHEAPQRNDAADVTLEHDVLAARHLDILCSCVRPDMCVCVIWPSEVAFRTEPSGRAALVVDALRAIPATRLCSAFGIESTKPPLGLTSAVVAASWRPELVPECVRDSVFCRENVTRVSIPFWSDRALLGFAGLAFSRRLTDIEWAWYTGCAVALAETTQAAGWRGDNRESSRPDTVRSGGVRSDAASQEASPALSPRELEVAIHLLDGYSTINTAAILGLKETTVRTLVRRIYKKLDVCNRVQLARKLRG